MKSYDSYTTRGPIVIQPGARYNVPLIGMPPTSGSGPATCESHFSFEIDATQASAELLVQIGVTNPSQPNIPMWPWLGVMHTADPGATIFTPVGTRVLQTLHRLDAVDPLQTVPGYLPIPWDWKITGSPQLEAYAINSGILPVTLYNVMFWALANRNL